MAEKKKKAKFVRTDFRKYSKLGVRRKKKQVYRKAKGIDNKIRLNMKGHTTKVKVGHRSEKVKRDLIKGLVKVTVSNVEDLKNVKEGQIGIVAKVGAKKKNKIAKYALENNIKLFNLNPKKFLGIVENELKQRKEKKEKRKQKKDKKAKEKEEKRLLEKERQVDKGQAAGKKNSEEKNDKKETIEKKVEETSNEQKQTSEQKSESKPNIKEAKGKKEIQTNNYGRGK